MCEFHVSNGNDLGDIWWTDKHIDFSSIDLQCYQMLRWSPNSTDSTNQNQTDDDPCMSPALEYDY